MYQLVHIWQLILLYPPCSTFTKIAQACVSILPNIHMECVTQKCFNVPKFNLPGKQHHIIRATVVKTYIWFYMCQTYSCKSYQATTARKQAGYDFFNYGKSLSFFCFQIKERHVMPPDKYALCNLWQNLFVRSLLLAG